MVYYPRLAGSSANYVSYLFVHIRYRRSPIVRLTTLSQLPDRRDVITSSRGSEEEERERGWLRRNARRDGDGAIRQ